jgi:hypothetical protein
MAVMSGWDLGSEADRAAGWGRTVALGVAGVTRRGPADSSNVGLRRWVRGGTKPECDRIVPAAPAFEIWWLRSSNVNGAWRRGRLTACKGLTLFELLACEAGAHLVEDRPGLGITMTDGQREPLDSLNWIGSCAAAQEEHQPEVGLSAGMPLLGGALKPSQRQLVISLDTESVMVAFGQVVLRVGIALLGTGDRSLASEGPGAIGPFQSRQQFPEQIQGGVESGVRSRRTAWAARCEAPGGPKETMTC